MSNDIAEAKGQQPMGDAAAIIEKKARQLVYDSRYETKNVKATPEQKVQLVLQRISKSTAMPAVKVRAKQMVLKKRVVKEDFIADIQETATNNIASAMFKVFVEGVNSSQQIDNSYLNEMDMSSERKYKIRVTDPKTGNSYVRYATREKISQLRAQGLKVELTEHGEPREGERKGGEDTARAKKSRKLDPVGKEDADVDNDGKPNDPNDKYIMKRRAAIGKAIAMRKEELDPVGQEDDDVDNDGKSNTKSDKYLKKRRAAIGKEIETRKEDYVWTEAKVKNEKTNGTAGVDNYASGAIKIFPKEDEGKTGVAALNAGFEAEGPVLFEKSMSKAQQRFMGMVYAAKKGETPASPEVAKAAEGMSKKAARDFAKTKHEGLPEKKKSKKRKGKKVNEAVEVKKEQETDSRADRAFREVLKNKLRSAMGVKNPIVMVDPDKLEDTYNKMATKSSAKMDDGMCEAVGGPVKLQPKSGLGGGVPSYPAGQEPKATGAKLPFEKAAKDNLMKPLQVAHFEPTGTTISERERGDDEEGPTKYEKVDPKKHKKDMEFWRKNTEAARKTFKGV